MPATSKKRRKFTRKRVLAKYRSRNRFRIQRPHKITYVPTTRLPTSHRALKFLPIRKRKYVVKKAPPQKKATYVEHLRDFVTTHGYNPNDYVWNARNAKRWVADNMPTWQQMAQMGLQAGLDMWGWPGA